MNTRNTFLSIILIFTCFFGYSQTINTYTSGKQKGKKHSFHSSNLMIESIAIEFTMLDLINYNSINSTPSLDFSAIKSSLLGVTQKNKAVELVQKEQILAKQLTLIKKGIRAIK